MYKSAEMYATYPEVIKIISAGPFRGHQAARDMFAFLHPVVYVVLAVLRPWHLVVYVVLAVL